MRQGNDKQEDRPTQDRPTGDRLDGVAPRRLELVDESLECVWSGFPGDERSCRSRIPASVVVRAWHREMQLRRAEEGFFHFSWRSGMWLGYGLRDGSVRGVYCPTHCAERTDRQSTRLTIGQRDPGERRSDRQAGTALQ
jgi:hypothetical protein